MRQELEQHLSVYDTSHNLAMRVERKKPELRVVYETSLKALDVEFHQAINIAQAVLPYFSGGPATCECWQAVSAISFGPGVHCGMEYKICQCLRFVAISLQVL